MPLCGNSIGMDRRFLAAYLPDIENWLHYRSVDVSSVKELVRRWYPAIKAARPHKAGSHRALDDIRESVDELRYYRERVFIPTSAGVGRTRTGRPFHVTCPRPSVTTTDQAKTATNTTTRSG